MICSNTYRNAKSSNATLETNLFYYENKLRCPDEPLVQEMFSIFQDAIQTKIIKNNSIINQYEQQQ